jgi:hypothetical protein
MTCTGNCRPPRLAAVFPPIKAGLIRPCPGIGSPIQVAPDHGANLDVREWHLSDIRSFGAIFAALVWRKCIFFVQRNSPIRNAVQRHKMSVPEPNRLAAPNPKDRTSRLRRRSEKPSTKLAFIGKLFPFLGRNRAVQSRLVHVLRSSISLSVDHHNRHRRWALVGQDAHLANFLFTESRTIVNLRGCGLLWFCGYPLCRQ